MKKRKDVIDFKMNEKSIKIKQNVKKSNFLYKKSKQLFGCNYKMTYLCSDTLRTSTTKERTKDTKDT